MYKRYTTRYNDIDSLGSQMGSRTPAAASDMNKKSSTQSMRPKQEAEIIIPKQKDDHIQKKPEHKLQKDNPASLLSGLNLGGIFDGILGGKGGGIFQDGKILGLKFDDILIIFLIYTLIQNKEETDWMLIIALGYVFLGDKFFSDIIQ